MPGIVVVGSQWGDEGKGKVIDVFSSQSDMVVRYQGGANAGHTLLVDQKKTVLHLVPSGVLHPNTICVIAGGVVLDVEALAGEIRALREGGLLQNPKQLLISDSATVLMPFHRLLDEARENALGHDKIGTTRKGIGPAYEDRASRKAILFGDLFEKDELAAKLEEQLREKNFLFERLYGLPPVRVGELVDRLRAIAGELEQHRSRDTALLIHKALKAGKKVLFEGAQGTLLDVNHGTYPFVTSSSTVAGSACTGAGVGPQMINQVIGITKAYTTRVGGGPFPTEQDNEIGQRLRKVGSEFGATTGRERRCGWLDLVALRYAIRINGITSIALMKIDVLSGLEEIPVCVGYDLDGQVIADYPVAPGDLARVKPVYQNLRGWKEELSESRSVQDLPLRAREYIQFISQEVGIPIDVISVGPARHQTLWVKPLFN